MKLVRWSADLAVLNCEIHEAEACMSGWVDPEWSVFTVGPSRESDGVPTVMPEGTEDPGAWLAMTVGAVIGIPDGCHHTDRPGAWTAADDRVDMATGVHARVRAGAEGFELAEVIEANRLLLGLMPGQPCCPA
jgi:hypothetical protein